jgi:hypothetical protein
MRRLRHQGRAVGAAVVIIFVMAIVAACKSDDDAPPPDPSGSCAALASRCHKYDKISKIGHDCHELGHAGDDNACFPKKAECLANCPETDGSTTHPTDDGGTPPYPTDSGSDAVSLGDGGDGNPCEAHCACLMETCATETGYPFTAGVEQCKTTCNGWTKEEKVCLPKWCIKAKTAGAKTHFCEHAWGQLGTDECETLP